MGTTPSWPVLCAIWAVIGMGSGAVLTPAGNVIRRSSAPADRPALFAAQFSLSHACWLLSYPIAGLLATWRGYPAAWTLLVALAVLGTATALRAWPARETDQVEHCHPLGAADRPTSAAPRGPNTATPTATCWSSTASTVTGPTTRVFSPSRRSHPARRRSVRRWQEPPSFGSDAEGRTS
ncbi:MFS transporter [Gordonia crocea]|uniref:MFS transporter n=1 Tax=Gordonia crocea TaxID=589162 RepID=UPI001E4B2EE1|nr:MFS transporter [Gordonia crocea]